jgi:hypothetical protein
MYRYLKKNKMSSFCFSQNTEQEDKTSFSGGLIPIEGRKMWGEGVGGSIWCKYYV